MTQLAGTEPNNFLQVLKSIELNPFLQLDLITLLLQIKSSTNE